MSSRLEAILTAIHATPHRMTMSFAGAGSQALTWLHSVGGSSRTVLEATDRYTPLSLIEGTGFTPKRFTSLRVARALAASALERARYLDDRFPLFGLGCTATIATDRTKRGDHRCAVAVKDALGMVSYSLTLNKGLRERAGEEELVSLILLKAVAEACGLLHFPELPLAPEETLEDHFQPVSELQSLLEDKVSWVLLHPDGRTEAGRRLPDTAILSGSFNPLHDGHRTLAEVATTQLGKEVTFELPLVNADKAPIDLREARRRALQFSGTAPLLLTRTPLFSDKATVFPNSVFVLGADTAARLVDSRFYGNDTNKMSRALDELRGQGTRFLVAGRSRQGVFKTLDDLAIPETHRDLFEAVPETAFSMNISSTELREKQAQAF